MYTVLETQSNLLYFYQTTQSKKTRKDEAVEEKNASEDHELTPFEKLLNLEMKSMN